MLKIRSIDKTVMQICSAAILGQYPAQKSLVGWALAQQSNPEQPGNSSLSVPTPALVPNILFYLSLFYQKSPSLEDLQKSHVYAIQAYEFIKHDSSPSPSYKMRVTQLYAESYDRLQLSYRPPLPQKYGTQKVRTEDKLHPAPALVLQPLESLDCMQEINAARQKIGLQPLDPQVQRLQQQALKLTPLSSPIELAKQAAITMKAALKPCPRCGGKGHTLITCLRPTITPGPKARDRSD